MHICVYIYTHTRKYNLTVVNLSLCVPYRSFTIPQAEESTAVTAF